MQTDPVDASWVLGGGAVDLSRGEVRSLERVVSLTALEVELLRFLGAQNGAVTSRADLLREVWGYRSMVRSRAVDHAIKRLRKKIERDQAEPQHLLTVHGVGYRLVLPSSPVRPAPTFIGRSEELTSVMATLRSGAAVTLHGPAGIGKTALAHAILHRQAEAGGKGWFVDLTAVQNVGGVLLAVHVATETRQGTEPAELAHALGAWFAQQPRALLVLDNVEHLAAEVGNLVGQWRRAAPDLQLLVTSRVRLRYPAEHLVELRPLPAMDAEALFTQRLRAVGGQPADPEVVADVVRRLEHVPLAIELAASRGNLLTPHQILERLDQRLQLLAGPERTLRGALDWSWELASEAERTALVQLLVFQGGFTATQASEVLDLPAGDDPLDVLQALRDSSWLRAWRAPGTPEFALRLGMFLFVRDYVAERGAPSPALQLRHAEHMAHLGDLDTILATMRRNQAGAEREYLDEFDNLVVALDTALAVDRPDLATRHWRAMSKAMQIVGAFPQILGTARRVLAHPNLALADRALLLTFGGELHRRAGDLSASSAWVQEALAILEEGGNRSLHARACRAYGRLLRDMGQLAEGQVWVERTLELLEGIDDEFERCASQVALADGYRELGDLERADEAYQRAIAESLARGDVISLRNARVGGASVSRQQGRVAEAAEALEEVIAEDRRARRFIGFALLNLANLYAHELGDHEHALELYEEALILARSAGHRALECYVMSNMGTSAYAVAGLDLGITTFEDAIALDRQAGIRRIEAFALVRFGDLWLAEGAWAHARVHYEASAQVATTADSPEMTAGATVGLAQLALAERDLTTAQCLAAEGEAQWRAIGTRSNLAHAVCVRGQVAVARGAREEARNAAEEAITLVPQAPGAACVVRRSGTPSTQGRLEGVAPLTVLQRQSLPGARDCPRPAPSLHLHPNHSRGFVPWTLPPLPSISPRYRRLSEPNR